jgi:hypothetical protein
MEKQTKILIGLAAAGVVAYLVLKPKKAVAAQVATTPIESGTYDKPNPNDINDIFKYFHTCWDGYRTNNPGEDCKTRGGYNTGFSPKNAGSLQMERQCITYPC